MRVAALYDIHGNLPALDAVLAEMPEVEAIVVGGDVLPGPLARETLDRLASLPNVRYVMGNGDREAIEEFPEVADWPDTVTLDVDGLGPVLFCHGSPRSDTEMITILTGEERLAPMLEGVAEQTIVGGHTHRQFDRTLLGRRIVNAGSVGLPYEGIAAAFWLLLGPDVELRRTEYDVPAAVERLRAAGGSTLEWLGDSLIEPTDPDEVAAYFEGRSAES
jgi:predicted phosphodiesterase